MKKYGFIVKLLCLVDFALALFRCFTPHAFWLGAGVVFAPLGFVGALRFRRRYVLAFAVYGAAQIPIKDEARKATLVTQEEYMLYLELKERVTAQEFRVEDDKNQKYKGSTPLDLEDTGVQYWNDPVPAKK